MESKIILAFVMFVTAGVWFLIQYNKSKERKPRNPHEEMVYQDEIARREAGEDFNREKSKRLQNEKRKKMLGRNIEKSLRFRR